MYIFFSVPYEIFISISLAQSFTEEDCFVGKSHEFYIKAEAQPNQRLLPGRKPDKTELHEN